MGSNSVHNRPSLAVHFQLISIWDRLLQVAINGIEENFFKLGGSAELVPRMLREVQRATGRKVSVPVFLKQPTTRQVMGYAAMASAEVLKVPVPALLA